MRKENTIFLFVLLLLPGNVSPIFLKIYPSPACNSAEHFVGFKKKKKRPHDSYRPSSPFLFLISKALLSGKQKVNFLQLAQADLM